MKFVVLLSGGLDSVANLYLAKLQGEVLLNLTFNYGQRAFEKELAAAEYFSKKFNIPHRLVDVSSIFRELGGSSLVDQKKQVPTHADVQIDDLVTSQKSAKSVWVPNRNGIFLNIAAGFAEALGAQAIVPGFNLEEAQTFPDNSEAYLQAATAALKFSTANQVKVTCFTTGLNKTEIVAKLKSSHLPFEKLWPCYFAGDNWCMNCESCQRSLRALKENSITLPWNNGNQ